MVLHRRPHTLSTKCLYLVHSWYTISRSLVASLPWPVTSRRKYGVRDMFLYILEYNLRIKVVSFLRRMAVLVVLAVVSCVDNEKATQQNSFSLHPPCKESKHDEPPTASVLSILLSPATWTTWVSGYASNCRRQSTFTQRASLCLEKFGILFQQPKSLCARIDRK